MNKTRKLIAGVVAGIAGVALAFPAFAEVTVGGFMTQTVGFGDYKGGDEAEDSLHFDTNAEVIFTATGVTDGGIKVTAQVELEGFTGSHEHDIAAGGATETSEKVGFDQIDENWLSIEGDFGKVTLGGEDPAVITHGYVGIAGGYGSMGYYDDTDSFTPIGGGIGPVGYGDAQGIRYSTPSVNGFSGAVSYQPEPGDGLRSTTGNNDRTLTSVAGNYSTSMGAMSLTVGGGILTRKDDDAAVDPGNHWGAGVELGFGSNTIFIRTDVREDQVAKDQDRTNWGVAYERSVGNTTFGIGYAKRTDDGGAAADTEHQAVVAGAKHSLGGGTTVGVAIAWGEIDDGVANTADPDGTAVGAHIAFSF